MVCCLDACFDVRPAIVGSFTISSLKITNLKLSGEFRILIKPSWSDKGKKKLCRIHCRRGKHKKLSIRSRG